MKKILKHSLLLSLLAVFMMACSSQRGATGSNSISKGDVSGTWTVTDVSLEGFPEGYQVTDAFGMAPYRDFVGSTWTLYGGYGGQIALSNGTNQEIYWSMSGSNFQFKKIADGQRPRDVKEGYYLTVSEANKNSLTLKSPFQLANGNTAYIVYTFVSAK